MASTPCAASEVATAIGRLPVSLRAEVQRVWDGVCKGPASALLCERIDEATRVWAASPFVAGVCMRQPEMLFDLLTSGELNEPYRDGVLRERVRTAVGQSPCEQRLMCELRRLRMRQMVRVAWRDLSGYAGLNETLGDLSELAEQCIDHALDWCFRDLCARHGVPRDWAGGEQRLVVLGMGKLGGRELNFSSDVDLMFAYPAEGATDGDKVLENSQFFLRLGQRLIKVLSEITAEGFVFRVDMRLRPFGKAGPLAISFDAMEDYYQHHGRDWERYALIKARVVAGDRRTGEQLLSRLRPFVYRRYLDYGAFEALRKMKALINEEIKRRGLQDNIKLGPGGIREIEFTGQAFQLIHGGRDKRLRQREIQSVLRVLRDKDRLPEYAFRQLREAYVFLRRCENCLQMMADQQIHDVPSSGLQRERLAYAMGFEGGPAFEAALSGHRKNVHTQFEQVFAIPQIDELAEEDVDSNAALLRQLWLGKAEEAQAHSALRRAGFQAPAAVDAALVAQRRARSYELLSATGRERMDHLMPLLIAAAGQCRAPEAVLSRLLRLIEAIARRSVYLALLAEHPVALSQLVKLSAASPWIAEYLSRHPLLLDELLDPRQLYAPLDRDALAGAVHRELENVGADDVEGQMDRLRHFKHANVLRVAAVDVMGRLPLMKVSDQLTWIAEVILVQVLALCRRQMLAKHGEPRCVLEGAPHTPGLAIIGYGKLGGIELGYGSDLDLVFLHDSQGERQFTDGDRPLDNAVFFARLGQRIIHFLTVFTPAGVLYEVDARLRPSGASGLLVSSIQAYQDYQQHKAWTWEHQALVRARVVAGDPRIGQLFDRVRREVLRQPRDRQVLRREVREMRERMWEELGSTKRERFDLKKDPGGIADIEFMVQYAVLAHAHEYPSLVEYTDNIRILDSLASCRLMPAGEVQALQDIYRAYRDQVHALSLQGDGSVVSAAEFGEQRVFVQQLWRRLMEND